MLMLKPLCVIETMLFYGAVRYTYGQRWETLAGSQAELLRQAHSNLCSVPSMAHAWAALEQKCNKAFHAWYGRQT